MFSSLETKNMLCFVDLLIMFTCTVCVSNIIISSER